MLLAGDVGGTKVLLGLFDPTGDRPRSRMVREYPTLEFHSLAGIVDAFLKDTGARDLKAIVMGVAGPVNGLVARMTNVPWPADASEFGDRFRCPAVELLNDLEAMAYSVHVLEPKELAVLQEGVAVPTGNAALIAAGTGLGEAFLHNVAGRFVPAASEGGHADFAARTPREFAFAEEHTKLHGRTDCEAAISGHGLVNLARFTHATQQAEEVCPVIGHVEDAADLPAHISECALANKCDQCVEALDMFVDAYGAEAGNLALRAMASAGVYLGGGIAPKVLPAIRAGLFMESFRAKAPMADLLRTFPVAVILNPAAGLLGAAVRAQELHSPTGK